MENLFSTFAISGQGLGVQRQRLSAIANNIANANTTKGTDGKPFQREVVVVRATKQHRSAFQDEFDQHIGLSNTAGSHISDFNNSNSAKDNMSVNAVSAHDNAPPRMVYDPSHPDADANGNVHMPNVNIVTEMVDMISAQRGFEANTSVISSVKNIARDSLDI